MAKRPTSRATPTETTAPAAPKPRRVRAKTTPRPEPSIDDIRRRAFERYMERGGRHGGHFDDWIEAEKELTLGKKSQAKVKSQKPKVKSEN